jgi:hypothetical protein
MSRLKGVPPTSQSVHFESNRQKPSWCLLVITRYFIPAAAAVFAHSSASNFTGSKRGWSFSYSSTGIFALSRIHSAWPLLAFGSPIGHSPAGIA